MSRKVDECKPLDNGIREDIEPELDGAKEEIIDELGRLHGRGLHSSTFQLNVSTLCGIRWEHDSLPV